MIISDFPQGGGKPEQLFDVVIRTQAEFEALIDSPTWLDAVSVCFVGDGGTLKFTRSDGQGCKIPQTVKQLKGINSATIEVTNFSYSSLANEAAFWYETRPETNDYWISGLNVECNSATKSCGFYNCARMINCTGIGTAPGVNRTGIGFLHCVMLMNCTSTGAGGGGTGFSGCALLASCSGTGNSNKNGTGYGFSGCTQLINCVGIGNNGADGDSNNGGGSIGFYSCTKLINCTGSASSWGGSYGTGFSDCSQLANCDGTGFSVGGGLGYAFKNCSYLNGCMQHPIPPTTAFLGGTNTKVDNATVVAS